MCRLVATEPHSYLDSSARVSIGKSTALHNVIGGICMYTVHGPTVLLLLYTVEDKISATLQGLSPGLLRSPFVTDIYTLMEAKGPRL